MSIPAFGTWSTALKITSVGVAVALVIDTGLAARVLDKQSSELSVAPFVLRQTEDIALRTPDDADISRQAALRSPFDAGAGVPVAAPPVFAAAAAIPAPVSIVLLGTVLDAAGGFVMVQTADGRVQLVHIGERAGDYRLRTVLAGQATFEDQTGARTTLRLLTPGTAIRP